MPELAARPVHSFRDTREQLVERYLPLARHLARRYHGAGEREDLEQVACLALVKAVDRFDPDRGIAFTSFAVPTIVGELKRYFRDLGWTVRVPRSVQELSLRIDTERSKLTATLGRSPTAAELAEAAGADVERVLEALGAASAHRPDSLDRPAGEDGTEMLELVGGGVDPGFAQADDAVYVQSLLRTLPERQREILHLRFDCDLTQAEIASRLGLSQMHISRLIRQAIGTLRASVDAGPQAGGIRLAEYGSK
jgi:RNA polymerase sigma-B factor